MKNYITSERNTHIFSKNRRNIMYQYVMALHQMDIDGFKFDLFLLSCNLLDPMVMNFI